MKNFQDTINAAAAETFSLDGCPAYPFMHPLHGDEHEAYVDEYHLGCAIYAEGLSLEDCANSAQRDGWYDAEWDALRTQEDE